jgi:hypothetical protein
MSFNFKCFCPTSRQIVDFVDVRSFIAVAVHVSGQAEFILEPLLRKRI